ncbi:GIY-YIG nuclease family protein [Paracoccus sp. (in: a-proteobacteria)]|uniref:GIY-YIG nuclease family protein n=1 Tax=Paracoccus sp. TaxID=267 RepID=UPI002AFF35FA|nr:GIY-YIG nuclease family protein [Paracoccus sp. (in: a-proteobacteria)]
MDNRQLDDIFGIRPVPRRHKNGNAARRDPTQQRLDDLYNCAADRICIYILGPDDEGVSKVGVSRTPYRRMHQLKCWNGAPLRMCYFAEVSRAEGFAVEKAFHSQRNDCGETIKGEWVRTDRRLITRQIRGIMRDMGVVPSSEFGDTGETREGEVSSEWGMTREDRYWLSGKHNHKRY